MSGSAKPHDDERGRALSDWAESEDFVIPADAVLVRGVGETPGRAILAAAMRAEDVQRVANLGGRPALDGTVGSGPSPKRQVRLPRPLDALLIERADAEHRKPSDVMRDALVAYLVPGEHAPDSGASGTSRAAAS